MRRISVGLAPALLFSSSDFTKSVKRAEDKDRKKVYTADIQGRTVVDDTRNRRPLAILGVVHFEDNLRFKATKATN